MAMAANRNRSLRHGGFIAVFFAVSALAIAAVSGCAKTGGVDEGTANYKGPGPAKAGAPGMTAGGPSKPQAPVKATGPKRSTE